MITWHQIELEGSGIGQSAAPRGCSSASVSNLAVPRLSPDGRHRSSNCESARWAITFSVTVVLTITCLTLEAVLTPPSQARRVDRRFALQKGLAGEHLPIRALHLLPDNLFIGQVEPRAARTAARLPAWATSPVAPCGLSLIDAPSRSLLIRLAKRVNSCFRLICSRSGWGKKSPPVTSIFEPIRTSSKNAGISRQWPVSCKSHNTVSASKLCRTRLSELFRLDKLAASTN